jgi:hypothetical protein
LLKLASIDACFDAWDCLKKHLFCGCKGRPCNHPTPGPCSRNSQRCRTALPTTRMGVASSSLGCSSSGQQALNLSSHPPCWSCIIASKRHLQNVGLPCASIGEVPHRGYFLTSRRPEQPALGTDRYLFWCPTALSSPLAKLPQRVFRIPTISPYPPFHLNGATVRPHFDAFCFSLMPTYAKSVLLVRA